MRHSWSRPTALGATVALAVVIAMAGAGGVLAQSGAGPDGAFAHELTPAAVRVAMQYATQRR